LKALAKCYGLRFGLAGILKLANDLLIFVGPFCLDKIVSFIEEEGTGAESTPVWQAFLYVIAMALASALLSFVSQLYFAVAFRVSMHTRAAVVTFVYRKAFRLSNSARQGYSTGEIVNHMSVDAQRLMDLIPFLHQLWSAPLQIICKGFYLRIFFLGLIFKLNLQIQCVWLF
jgi:ABC-type multidrug transport system fused ATPase/permease subunit